MDQALDKNQTLLAPLAFYGTTPNLFIKPVHLTSFGIVEDFTANCGLYNSKTSIKYSTF